MTEKHYTWEEKIESLVTLAKAAGRYINSEETDLLSPSTRSDYYHDAQRKFREAYADFCEWRHDEPYVVDEIWDLLKRREYIDGATGIKLLVERDNLDYPDHPKLTVTCPTGRNLSIEEVNGAMSRLQERAGISAEQRMSPLYVLRERSEQ